MTDDGSVLVVKIEAQATVKEELKGMIQIIKDWRVIALIPMFLASNFFYPYVSFRVEITLTLDLVFLFHQCPFVAFTARCTQHDPFQRPNSSSLCRTDGLGCHYGSHLYRSRSGLSAIQTKDSWTYRGRG